MTTSTQKLKIEDIKFWVTLVVAAVSFFTSVYWFGNSIGKLTNSVDVIKEDVREMKIPVEKQSSINTDFDDRLKTLEQDRVNNSYITEHRSRNGKISQYQASN